MAIALDTMLQALFGIKTFPRENPITATVGIAAERILASNPQRVSFQVVNLSANNLYVGLSYTVAATEGIFIAPNGGIISLIWDRDFELCSHEWWAIAGGAASAVYVLENVIQ